MRFYPSPCFGDFGLHHVKTLHETARGLSRDFACFIDPVPHCPLGYSGELSQAAHGPASSDESAEMTVNGNGAHRSYVLPIVGKVKEGKLWR